MGAPSFEGRVVMITGGAAGIGRRFASELAARGAAIAIADIDGGLAQVESSALEGEGHVACGVQVDIAEHSAVDAAVEEVTARLGGIDVLINGAALHLMEWSVPVTSLSPERWRRLVDVNITGIVNCTRASRPVMASRGGGAVLNMSSVSGILSTTAYGVTKLAVRGLTVALADELGADNIRVNCLAPGPMDSESALVDLPQSLLDDFVQHRQVLKRPGSIDDLVGAMLFLCSADSSFITGETLIVSGGYPLRI